MAADTTPRRDDVLLDELMPVFDVAERHSIIVHAAPQSVFRAIGEADLGGGAPTKVLLALRAAPAAVLAFGRSPRRAIAEWRARRSDRQSGLRLADFERVGFRVLAERSPEELVIGLLGKFWRPGGGLAAVTVAHFAAGPPKGYALAGWNFMVVPRDTGCVELRTETRVWCAPDARLRFRMYWLLVRPGSGLIRRAMLRAIRREAERS